MFTVLLFLFFIIMFYKLVAKLLTAHTHINYFDDEYDCDEWLSLRYCTYHDMELRQTTHTTESESLAVTACRLK
jgi:hypothetical protein